MAEVRWIKVTTDIFENRKIRQLEAMPKGDTTILIWFKLMCLAGRVNDGGAVYLTPEMPYTEQTLALEMAKPVSAIRTALSLFENFGMIYMLDGVIFLASWDKYQSADKLERLRECGRARQARYMQKKRSPEEMTLPVTSSPMQNDAADKDKEKEKNKDFYLRKEKEAYTQTAPRQEDLDRMKRLLDIMKGGKPL